MRKDRKIKLAKLAHLLLFKRHRYPGVKEWELEKYLGRDYESVINDFNEYLEPLGLYVRKVEIEEESNKSIYYVVQPKYPLSFTEVKTFGWRVDEMAVLTVALAHILAGDGKASRKEVEETLKEKIPEWRVIRLIDRFIKMKYLEEDGEYLKIGLRTYLELDLKMLTSVLIGRAMSQEAETSVEDSSSQPQ